MGGPRFLSRGGLALCLRAFERFRDEWMMMDSGNIEPDQLAGTKWGLEAFRHIFHTHYYFERCGVILRADQDLHDKDKLLDGWIKNRLALEYCRGRPGYEDCEEGIERAIRQAVKKHRSTQYHHKIWMGEVENPRLNDYMEGAIDIICTILERRPYYARRGLSAGSLGEILENPTRFIVNFINEDKVEKLPYIMQALSLIRDIERPRLETINSLQDIPNIGVSPGVYERLICLRDLELQNIKAMLP
jgi:hypothetical protein